MRRLFLGTGNAHKVEEIRGILSGENFLTVSPLDYEKGFPEISEGETSYLENACKKASQYSIYTGFVSLADDTGLEVEALDGAPGPMSSRYFIDAGTSEEKYLALIELLKEKKNNNLNAKFVCEACVAYGSKIFGTFRGELKGSITFEPMGLKGFGYDPVFLLPNGRTLAQLSFEEKNNISHRAIAIKQAIPLLKKLIFEE